MNNSEEWDEFRTRDQATNSAGWTAIRVSLLFGSLAIALALVVTPLVSGKYGQRLVRSATGIDGITTATTRDKDKTYRMRRSVLQKSPSSVCVILPDGSYRGEC